MEIEIKRKAVHTLGVSTVALIYLFGKWYGALAMLLISFTFLFLGEYRRNKEKYKIVRIKALDEFEEAIEDEFKTYERKNELPFQGAMTFYFGCFLVTILFEPYIAIASIAVLALADSMSTLVGYFIGKHKLPINRKKSWEGSTAFFITSFLVLFFFTDPVKASVISIFAAFVEMLPKIEDNIGVPLATGILMLLL
jgi:dolichol kinase